MKNRYLFDSHSLLAFFQKEKGAKVVAEILQKSINQSFDRFICVINLGEIIYIIKRRYGDIKKLEIMARIHQLGLKILPASESIVFKAAEIKADYPISYADCFALTSACSFSTCWVMSLEIPARPIMRPDLLCKGHFTDSR